MKHWFSGCIEGRQRLADFMNRHGIFSANDIVIVKVYDARNSQSCFIDFLYYAEQEFEEVK